MVLTRDIEYVRARLGERRFRIARLHCLRSRPTQKVIARRVGISQQEVSRHLRIIFRELPGLVAGHGRTRTRRLRDDYGPLRP